RLILKRPAEDLGETYTSSEGFLLPVQTRQSLDRRPSSAVTAKRRTDGRLLTINEPPPVITTTRCRGALRILAPWCNFYRTARGCESSCGRGGGGSPVTVVSLPARGRPPQAAPPTGGLSFG